MKFWIFLKILRAKTLILQKKIVWHSKIKQFEYTRRRIKEPKLSRTLISSKLEKRAGASFYIKTLYPILSCSWNPTQRDPSMRWQRTDDGRWNCRTTCFALMKPPLYSALTSFINLQPHTLTEAAQFIPSPNRLSCIIKGKTCSKCRLLRPPPPRS